MCAPDKRAQLQGAITSVQSVSQLVGPFLFTLTFAYFIGPQAPVKLPGAPFLLASALLVLAMVIAARTLAATRGRCGPTLFRTSSRYILSGPSVSRRRCRRWLEADWLRLTGDDLHFCR